MRRAVLGATLALALALTGCQAWEAQGGAAELTLRGDLPWTTAPQIATSIEVDVDFEVDIDQRRHGH